MAHKFDPNDPYSVGYGHTIGEAYPQVIENMFNKSSKDSIVVRPGEAQSFVKNQNNNALKENGVSDTTENDFKGLGALDGTLGQYIPQAQNIYNSLYSKSKKQQEKEDRMNTGMMMLNFFTKMGAEASRPGATALGAASVAGADTASMYIKQVNAERARRDAEKKGIVGLASQLMTSADTKELALAKANNVKPAAIRTSTRGTQATYMKKQDAINYFRKFMKLTDPDFDRLVDSISAPSDDMIGKPVVIGQAYQELLPIKLLNKIVGFQLSPSSAGGKPEEVETRANRRKVLNKFKSEVLSQTTELVPTIQDALDKLLYSNIQTGGLTELTMPFKSIMSQLFNSDMTELEGLEFLRSISYKLAPKMRAPGSGSTSDIEFKAYQQAILDIGNTPFANYLSLYSMKKMKENTIKQFFLEENLMSQGASTIEINKQLQDIDKGIFTKFNILDADNKDLYKTEKERDDGISSWWSNLKPGTAIINRDSRGKKLFDVDDVFIVKGWENRGK